ncbi:MAG: glycosyltransferase family 39 protein, partial [Pseudomonadota bacterium]
MARIDSLIGGLGVGLDRVLDWAGGAAWRGYLLVSLIAIAVALPGFVTLPVTDRDEARFVQATKQMMQSGDYIDIRFQDEPRWKKPVGIYWLQAATALPAGGPEAPIWAYRLPSMLAAILAALATVWAGRAILGARASVLGGMLMATTLLLAAEATIAKTDASLTLTAVLVMAVLFRLMTGQTGRYDWIVFWLAIAGSILLKGPIVPVIALLAIAAAWIA